MIWTLLGGRDGMPRVERSVRYAMVAVVVGGVGLAAGGDLVRDFALLALLMAAGGLFWVLCELREHWCQRCGRLIEPPPWHEPDWPENARIVRLGFGRRCPYCQPDGRDLLAEWEAGRRSAEEECR